jgi:GH25 family lysozyme M1 (1,4-beta-N-acetylmuramidase)
MTILNISRKGQATLFIIIAMVIIIGGALLLQAYKSSRSPAPQNPDYTSSADRDSISFFINSCLEYTTKNAILEHGLKPGVSEARIQEYIRLNLPLCTDGFSTYKSKGFSVAEGKISPTVQISDDVVAVGLDYPVQFTKGDTVISYQNDSYLYHRKIMKDILPTEDTYIVSDDQRTQFIIPAGTQATVDGNPVTSIGMQLVDRNFDGQTNKVLAGMVAFKGLPDGVQFSKPITIIHYYNSEDIPTTIPESDLRLAFYSKELGVWVAFPTSVDTVNDVLMSHTTHFTTFGAVLRCTSQKDLTEHVTTLLVKQDCDACDGWTQGNPPSGVGALWIQSDAIAQGKKIGTAPECVKTDITRTVADCSDCKGTCSRAASQPCTETYYSYDKTAIEGTNPDGYVQYAANGNACVWAENGGTDPNPVIAMQDTTRPNPAAGWDILVRAYCPDTIDQCLLQPDVSFAGSVLKHPLKVVNGPAPNSCIAGKVITRYSGNGIDPANQESYYLCDQSQENTQQEMPVIGGEIDQVIMSTCTKFTENDGGYKWVPNAGAEIKIDGGIVNAGARRGRDNCPEGDASPPAVPYPACPVDFDQNYNGKEFTVSACIDTRNRDFCDWYGDFPAMQYTKGMAFSPGTKLKVFGSALRNGRCWLLVEAQQKIGDNKPDFYVKLDQVQDYITKGTTKAFDGSVCMASGSSAPTTVGQSKCGGTDQAKGLDVSSYQGSIDWEKVHSSGISFSFIKASESTTYRDSTFNRNWQDAKAAGVLRGAYHFMRPTDGKAQAEVFLSMIMAGGKYDGELPPAADLEDPGVTAQQLKDFLQTVKDRTGRTPLIYTSPGMWSTLSYSADFSGYSLWIANWGVECPTVPATWPNWDFWQWCGDCANTLQGVSGNLDYDVFHGNLDALKAYAK